jgi:LPPG:FO 2-phospho-L-lactate transferase
MRADTQVVALSGGVGGAKLALGLSRVLPAGALTVVANVADDFEHLGLCISPDLDTLMYVLAGLDDSERGWGRRGETWAFMAALGALGGETWFQLGDGDLATHVERTRRLRAGESLSQITADLCRRLGIDTRVLPATDDRVRTMLQTDAGLLEFQDYFVRRQCAPKVGAITFAGTAAARAHPAALAALASPGLDAVVICPSNPFISIEPMLALTGLRDAIAACRAPVIAVSPIIGGKAVKGPTAKMMAELGLSARASAVARRYGSLLDGYVLDTQDADEVRDVPIRSKVTRTMMQNLADREALAQDVLAFAAELARTP